MTIIQQLETRDSFLTTQEVADLLNLKTGTVQRWAKTGALDAVRISPQQYRFDPQRIAKWISDHEEKTQLPVGEIGDAR